MSNFVNYTTKYSQINGIKRDIMELKQQISIISRNFSKYNQQLKELMSNINSNINNNKNAIFTMDGDIISDNIKKLSDNVDIMLNQMLEAQRQLTEANTIIITRKMNIEDIAITVDKGLISIKFKRKPTGLEDYITLRLKEKQQPLKIYFDYNHHSTHTDDPNYDSYFTNTMDNNNEFVPCMLCLKLKNVNSSVEFIDHDVSTKYEYDQDQLISFIVNKLDEQNKGYFQELNNQINEIHSSVHPSIN